MSGLEKSIWVGVCVVGLVLAANHCGGTSGPRPAAKRVVCQNNIRQVVLGVHNFESVHLRLPQNVSSGDTPTLSWRAEMLPYWEEQNRYDAIDFAQSWDSEYNAAFASPIPSLLRCPADSRDRESPLTSYVAVAGAGTMWPGMKPICLEDITDGLGTTIANMESTRAKVHWMSPRDLPLAHTLKADRYGKPMFLLSPHPGGANVAIADGSSRFLSDRVSPDVLHAMSTIAGNEPIDVDW